MRSANVKSFISSSLSSACGDMSFFDNSGSCADTCCQA
ncbi:Uncharacterised protein [Vibrio cholerae]|nr:Uncharacterised protein [Vibrio cholerae]